MSDSDNVIPIFSEYNKTLPPTFLQEHAYSHGYNSTVGNSYKNCPWLGCEEFVPEVGVEVFVTWKSLFRLETQVELMTFHQELIENEKGKCYNCYWYSQRNNHRIQFDDINDSALWCYPPKRSAKGQQ